jgi:hypothetical protein
MRLYVLPCSISPVNLIIDLIILLMISNDHLVPRALEPWIFSYEKSLTITIPDKTWRILLHYDGSMRCTCPPNKFVFAFKVVKLFLKYPALPVEATLNHNYPR